MCINKNLFKFVGLSYVKQFLKLIWRPYSLDLEIKTAT